jgi:putative methyltransferase (TIGR04325 family)
MEATAPLDVSIGDRIEPPYFTGVYPEGLAKAVFEDPFNTQGWIDHCRIAAKRMGIAHSAYLGDPARSLAKTAAAKALHYLRSPRMAAAHLVSGTACSRHLLPVAQMIRDVHMRTGRARVLDIGGGFGDNFAELAQVLPARMMDGLTYDVIDNEPSCELGREIYARYKTRPSFTSDHEGIVGAYDVVLVIGTLQYVPSWRDFLTSMNERCRRYLYVARSPIAVASSSFSTDEMICPVYGSHAGRLLGTTRINVVGLADLQKAMSDWSPCFEFMDTDYSTQFARLPAPWRDVRYFCMAWKH